MNISKEKLILFTRYPVPGKAKTRLIPELGENGAADLQEIMTGLAVLNARCFSAVSGTDIEMRFEGAGKTKMCRWLGKGIKFRCQGKGDLGQRMNRAFTNAFEEGCERVVIIGCDCPQIDRKCLSAAFNALKNNDIVIGPATDGGYYLIGLTKPVPEIFMNINWGTDSVFQQTITIAEDKRLKTAQLHKLSDIDRPQDLDLCRDMNLLTSSPVNNISVIIAALNEQSHIQKTIAAASDGAGEVIVADGGSQDNTIELAGLADAKTLNVPYGRACQLNTAALGAKGDILLFLHADTILPPHYAKAVIETVEISGFSAGAFRLTIDSNALGVRLIEKAVNFRSGLLKLPYGDQSLFMTKDTFLRIGGFADMPIMEDFEMVKRLQRRGRVITISKSVKTSARRWLQLGVLRTTIVNQLVIAGFKIGISPLKLAGFYRNQKKRYHKIKSKRKDVQNEPTLLRTERSR